MSTEMTAYHRLSNHYREPFRLEALERIIEKAGRLASKVLLARLKGVAPSEQQIIQEKKRNFALERDALIEECRNLKLIHSTEQTEELAELIQEINKNIKLYGTTPLKKICCCQIL